MFLKSAQYYDAAYGFKDYAAEAREIHAVIQRYRPRAKRLLDVACGTGGHLAHLSAWYEVEGLDLSDALLSGARLRCPDVRVHHASMVDFSLSTEFDVITCLFSSIAYVKTVENLSTTLSSMRKHLRPDGMVVLEPWFTPETYRTGTITANFVNHGDVKAAWMYTSEVDNGLAVLDVSYLFGKASGVEHFNERHELGVFSDDQYRAAIESEGLSVTRDPVGPLGRGLYIGLDQRPTVDASSRGLPG
jgi:SAM-dependent methyltransferase